MVKYNAPTSAVFAALSDETRFDIMQRLIKHAGLSAGTIASPYHMSLPAVSKHLRVLEEAKLVHMTKDGRRRVYYPTYTTLASFRSFIENSELFWDKALDRLVTHLEPKK